jgi:hypothetical protein
MRDSRDIVDRLTDFRVWEVNDTAVHPKVCEDAAAEILRLRAELAAERARNKGEFW